MKTTLYLADCKVLKDKGLYSFWFEKMPEKRQKKISRIKMDKDRRLSLGAGILLEKVLKQYDKSSVRIDKNGKPYLPESDIYFNLSHSGDYALLAVSDLPVGCDIEIISEYNDKLAKRFFHDEEYALLQNSEDRQRLFYRLWTLKESVIKADGRGLTMSLDSFFISFKNGLPSASVNGKNYFLKEYEAPLPYCISACCEGESRFGQDLKIVDLKKEE